MTANAHDRLDRVSGTYRLHCSLGDIPPAEFEEHHYRRFAGIGELVETE